MAEEGFPDTVRVMPENQEEVEVIAADGEVTARASRDQEVRDTRRLGTHQNTV
jgi:hypothetical protein